jgi:fused signal recognition particle receptor
VAGFSWFRKKATDATPPAPVVETTDFAVPQVAEAPVSEAKVAVAEQKPAPVSTKHEPKPAAVESSSASNGSRSFASRIRSIFVGNKFDSEDLESLEDILLLADFGLNASAEVVSEVKRIAKSEGAISEAELKAILVRVLAEALEVPGRELNLTGPNLPYVFLVVGVNGVGKTTTIGKLAKWLAEGDWQVVIGAADTFRAAAVDQVATWAQRAGAKLVAGETEGQDPASVAFKAVETAIDDKADIVIIDTAGRLQNKQDLMDELGKIRRVIEKNARVSETLLVLDATTGQNGLVQARAFAEAAGITGVVLTKVDGTAKGGIVYTIQKELGVPVKLIGFGEGVNDFAFFEADQFALGLVGQ